MCYDHVFKRSINSAVLGKEREAGMDTNTQAHIQ